MQKKIQLKNGFFKLGNNRAIKLECPTDSVFAIELADSLIP